MSTGSLKGICPDIPANLNIRIIFANVGAVQGIPRQEILAVQIRYKELCLYMSDTEVFHFETCLPNIPRLNVTNGNVTLLFIFFLHAFIWATQIPFIAVRFAFLPLKWK